MAGVAVQSGARPRGNRLLGLAALLFGILTAALVIAYLRNKEEEVRVQADATVPVVVASREIPLGTNITSSMLQVKLVTPGVAIPAAFSETAKVIGLRARATIPENAQIVPGMVVQSGGADALSFVVPPGKRAVAVTLSEVIGSGGHIRPGDVVDVMVTVEAWKLVGGQPTSGSAQPKGVYTILQNVEVLAVRDEAEQIAASGPDSKDTKDKNSATRVTTRDQERNKSVTLAVDPQQAQLLFLADQEGKIRLALRPFGERDETPIAPILEPLAFPAPATPASRR
jgi:pilus assembly protein CpaB